MDEHVTPGNVVAAVPPVAVSMAHVFGLTLGEFVQATTAFYTLLLIGYFIFDKMIRPHLPSRKQP
jgi:hypothetical protein